MSVVSDLQVNFGLHVWMVFDYVYFGLFVLISKKSLSLIKTCDETIYLEFYRTVVSVVYSALSIPTCSTPLWNDWCFLYPGLYGEVTGGLPLYLYIVLYKMTGGGRSLYFALYGLVVLYILNYMDWGLVVLYILAYMAW